MKKIKKKKNEFIYNYSKVLKNYEYFLNNRNIKNQLYANEYLIKNKTIKLIKYNNESKILIDKFNSSKTNYLIYSINKFYKSPFFIKNQISYKKNNLNKYLLNYFFFLIFFKKYKKNNINIIEGRILNLSYKKKILVYSFGKIFSMQIFQLLKIKKKKKYNFYKLIRKIRPFLLRKYNFKIFKTDKYFKKMKISRKAYVNDVKHLVESFKFKKK